MRISDWSSDVCSSDLSLSLLIAALAALGIWASDAYIEDAAVRDLMERELSYMVGPHAPAVRTNDHDALRFFPGEQIPARLRHFGPGYYEDLQVDGRTFNLLVRDRKRTSLNSSH